MLRQLKYLALTSLFSIATVHAGNIIGVAVGADNNGLVLTTSDGMNWSATDVVPNEAFEQVAWNGSEWMAVGLLGNVITSTDGVNWKKHTIDPNTRPRMNTVGWDGKQWIIGGSDGMNIAFWSSSDDEHWQKATVNFPDYMSQYLKISYDGTKWTAVLGWHLVGSVLSSTDGITWTQQSVGASIPVFGIHGTTLANGQHQWIALGNGIVQSADGIHWTADSVPNYSYDAAGWNGKQWVAAGITPLISNDGINWTSAQSDGACLPNAVAWDNAHSRWVAVGYKTSGGAEQGCFSTSNSDGTGWSTQNAPVYASIFTINSVAFKN